MADRYVLRDFAPNLPRRPAPECPGLDAKNRLARNSLKNQPKTRFKPAISLIPTRPDPIAPLDRPLGIESQSRLTTHWRNIWRNG